MSINKLRQLLSESTKDDALVRHFLGVWPVIESILEAFSRATKLPIFALFNGQHVFQSSVETMPGFCRIMLGSSETSSLCKEDGQRRATKKEPEIADGIQLCHAGLINGRREIETGIGTLCILFGSKQSTSEESLRRRFAVINRVSTQNAAFGDQLREVAESEEGDGEIDPSDLLLMGAITEIIQGLINATVGFRSLTINMAHELSVMLLGMGLLTKELGDLVDEQSRPKRGAASLPTSDLMETQKLVHTQCRLGLYIVRNFLSHASETRYGEVVRPRFKRINLGEVLEEMVELHRLPAAKKDVSFQYDVSGLPTIFGSDMELRRLFNNVLNNAVKYSYHSVPNAKRTVRIRSKVPYDPGFKQARFAVVFENYGLGLSDEEKADVFKPGFRGKQAIAEVPIGSGIGLSEALKIMKLHKGEIRFQSKELYKADEERVTYLTSVDLIFPYVQHHGERRG
jgi:signal transduction histidine kinase